MGNLSSSIQSVINDPHIRQMAQVGTNLYFSHLGLLKAISILITALFVAATAFFIARTGWLAVRVDRVEDVILKSHPAKKRSLKVWRKVQAHLFAGDDNSLKLALLEADKILDEALRVAGFLGENLGDRLKKLDESKLPNIQEIWDAHKLRNRLAHEPDFKLNRNTAERALAIYEQAFKDLGLLD